ncbi:MAG: hypothetical protein HQM10_18860 [Candidatus Riflebacteria bacterium]|nr:hypothetical protein [Candidatus Riflebacteria bacterium]
MSFCLNLKDAIMLAKATASDGATDKVCLSCTKLCLNYMEVVTLANVTKSKEARDNVCISGTIRCKSVDEVLAVSKEALATDARDKVLIAGVRCVRNLKDAETLAKAASNKAVSQKIIEEAKKILAQIPQCIVNSAEITTSTSKESSQADTNADLQSYSLDLSDNHRIDKERVSRVNKFINAVKNDLYAEETLTKLTPADISLDVVKSAIADFNEKNAFRKLYQKE